MLNSLSTSYGASAASSARAAEEDDLRPSVSRSGPDPRSALSDEMRLLARGPVGRSRSDVGAQGMARRQLPPIRAVSTLGLERLAGPLEHEVRSVSGVSMPVRTSSVERTLAAGGTVGRRELLLSDYQAAIARPLDLDRALAAVKLRAAAEIFCEKNNLARFAPRPPRTSAGERRLQALVDRPVDELIAAVEADPRRFSRTELTDVAQRHLLAALNIDVALYRKGVHKAGLYEGLHSAAGRVVSVAAAAISAGVSEIDGVTKAVT